MYLIEPLNNWIFGFLIQQGMKLINLNGGNCSFSLLLVKSDII